MDHSLFKIIVIKTNPKKESSETKQSASAEVNIESKAFNIDTDLITNFRKYSSISFNPIL